MRPQQFLAKPNILRILQNAYITTGKTVKKRPCLMAVATLEAGTVGLKSFKGQLQTFYGQGTTITHANTLFKANRVPKWDTGADPIRIHYADQYNAILYVVAEFAGPIYRHYYLDDPGAWQAVHAYATGAFVRPTVVNGFRFKVTAGGGGNSGAGEPVWPTTVGGTVVDGALTWTCQAFDITDTNCPHTKPVMKQSQKMFAMGTDGTVTRYCKTGDPRDWTTVNDAGFLAVGLYARGSDQGTALGLYGNNSLVVFFSDNTELWKVDPNPANMSLTWNIEGVGTIFAKAAGPVSHDLFFLAQTGFRSASVQQLTNNVQEADIGSAIDSLVRADIATSDDPISIYYPKLGQFWSIIGTRAWVYSFSRASKISAWSKFTFPFSIDDACVLNQELYVRTGNDVYKVSDAVTKDGVSSIPLVDVLMYPQDGKRPGVTKQFTGFDFLGTGMPTVSFQFFDPDTQNIRETAGYEYPAMTEPGGLYPVELMTTRIAPHFQHQKDEAFEIGAAMLHYENLSASV